MPNRIKLSSLLRISRGPHDLKLERARHHLKELELEVRRWLEEDGYALAVEPNPEPPDYLIKAEILRPLESEPLGLLIGDVLQNARSALEYVAYALGNAGTQKAHGRDMTDDEAKVCGFPIVGDVDREGYTGRGPDLFAAAAQQKLGTVSPEAIETIKELQPFYDGEGWEFDGLWTLNELARLDRHRFVHLAAIRSGRLRLDPATSRNVKIQRLTVYSEELLDPEAGAEIAEVIAFPANPKEEMHMNFRDALSVGFAADTPMLGQFPEPVIRDLEYMCSAVASAIRSVRPHLP